MMRGRSSTPLACIFQSTTTLLVRPVASSIRSTTVMPSIRSTNSMMPERSVMTGSV
jgi:hypothetical protein